jgi:hypothetical protein
MKTTTLALALLAAAGCGPTVTVDDDVDIDWDFIELTGPSSSMHTPYVAGASMTLYVHSTDDKETMNGWTMESSDTSVFTLETAQHDKDHHLWAKAHAGGDGTAQVRVRNAEGNVVLSQPVEVRVPDRVQVMAHGLLIIGKSEDESKVDEVRLLSGGTATFLVRYYLSNRILYGNGTLGVDAPPQVVATTPRTYLFEDRDWLQVTPNMAGASSLGLKVNGYHFADLPLTVVDAGQVQSLRILGADESHAKKDQWLVALGQAYDAQMRQVYGVEFQWEVNGQSESGFGDLYRYRFDPTKPKMLAANYNNMAAVVMIHSGAGYVDSSNHIGCSAVPGAGTPWALLPLFLVVGAYRMLIKRRA